MNFFQKIKTPYIIVIAVLLVFGYFMYKNSQQFALPKGETIPADTSTGERAESARQIFTTDGVRHSVPLDDILSGGVPKDGIPSIDNPKFISVKDADEFLSSDDIGLGFIWKGEARFYPYQILVWHEIVNDEIRGDGILITYCPLCATGIVFDPTVDSAAREFGVSGKLWNSNLLMYNRSENGDDESLWSQVLGEAVLGKFTGKRLRILESDTVKYGDWKRAFPATKVLSRDTGEARRYGADPYGDYYTSDQVSFGATFSDERLHPKALVLGVEIDGRYKAYKKDSLKLGTTVDNFSGREIKIDRDEIGAIRIYANDDSLPYIESFWFSWLAVHPETLLYE